jgi:hypothetical protein
VLPSGMSTKCLSWVDRKLQTASALAAGGCGGTYGDAILIVSAVESGIAAKIWPGPNKDRFRFCEIWSAHADPTLTPNYISLPLLIASLEADGDTVNAATLRHTNPSAFTGVLGVDTLVVTGDTVDRDEAIVVSLCPSLTLRTIRKYSYASLFYSEARSALTHEFSIGASASTNPMLENLKRVSYTNDMDPPYRRIHFHMEWLSAVVRSISAASAFLWDTAPHPDPAKWWVQG